MIRELPKELDHPMSASSYEVVRWIMTSYFRFFHCIRIRGRQNVPLEGPLIIAPNHLSYYDPPLVGIGIPRQLRFMAWDALFRVPVLGWAMRKLGAFPVDTRQADTAAYKQSLLLLRHGNCVVIFPEGKRGLGQTLEPFETGVARLALRSGATIVPVSLTGVAESWPRWNKIPRWFRPMQVKFHPPIPAPVGDFRGEDLRLALEELNEKIRQPIARRYEAHRRLGRIKGRRLVEPPKQQAALRRSS